jgi:hypothetical protein
MESVSVRMIWGKQKHKQLVLTASEQGSQSLSQGAMRHLPCCFLKITLIS